MNENLLGDKWSRRKNFFTRNTSWTFFIRNFLDRYNIRLLKIWSHFNFDSTPPTSPPAPSSTENPSFYIISLLTSRTTRNPSPSASRTALDASTHIDSNFCYFIFEKTSPSNCMTIRFDCGFFIRLFDGRNFCVDIGTGRHIYKTHFRKSYGKVLSCTWGWGEFCLWFRFRCEQKRTRIRKELQTY